MDSGRGRGAGQPRALQGGPERPSGAHPGCHLGPPVIPARPARIRLHARGSQNAARRPASARTARRPQVRSSDAGSAVHPPLGHPGRRWPAGRRRHAPVAARSSGSRPRPEDATPAGPRRPARLWLSSSCARGQKKKKSNAGIRAEFPDLGPTLRLPGMPVPPARSAQVFAL